MFRFKKILPLIVVFVVGLSSAAVTGGNEVVATGDEGTLDSTFGPTNNGIVISDLSQQNETIRASAVQPDGKIVVVGKVYNGSTHLDDFVVARYNPNGELDTSFEGDGFVFTQMGSGTDEANAVAVQPDGKIVVGGQSWVNNDYQFALIRYLSDGQVDQSFGGGNSDGRVITDISGDWDDINAIAVQPDGKIIAVGEGTDAGPDVNFAVARYLQNGTPDGSFGVGGKLTTAIRSGSSIDVATSVAVQPDGKIVVGGYSISSNSDFAVVRYLPNGDVDNNFANLGISLTDVAGESDAIYSIALQPDGKVVAGGASGPYLNENFALIRYTVDGAPDPSFGASGLVLSSVTTGIDIVRALAIYDNNKILVAGNADRAAVAARYQSNGTLDLGFGIQGVATVEADGSVYLSSLATQPDGKIVVSGFSFRGVDDNFFLARLNSHLSPVPEVVVPSNPTPAPLSSPPTAVGYQAGNRRVTVYWNSDSWASSYVVTNSRGEQLCTSIGLSCEITNLRNGKSHTYNVYSVNQDGIRSTTATPVKVWAGFQVKNTSLKRNKSYRSASIVTTPSKGIMTLRPVSGKCRFRGTRLVASPRRGTCKLRLTVEAKRPYPAMSTTLILTVR